MGGLLTVREVAVRLKISLASVYQLCGQGRLPHVRFGLRRGTIRIAEQDLTAFVEACKGAHRSTNAAGLKHIKARPAGSP